jgi:hypothetical protein
MPTNITLNEVMIKEKPNVSKTNANKFAREDRLTHIEANAKLNDIVCNFLFFELFTFLFS